MARDRGFNRGRGERNRVGERKDREIVKAKRNVRERKVAKNSMEKKRKKSFDVFLAASSFGKSLCLFSSFALSHLPIISNFIVFW